jgi:hypothetical protein
MQSPAQPRPAPPAQPTHGTTRLSLTLTLDSAKGPKTTEYTLRFVACHERAQAPAWRLTRTATRAGITRTVALTASGPRCDCPASRYQRGSCKHVRALKAHGLPDVDAVSRPTGTH